jgi:hypothetical protein
MLIALAFLLLVIGLILGLLVTVVIAAMKPHNRAMLHPRKRRKVKEFRKELEKL